mmetsp:Transcript_12511/g.23115  ORF Transcript_12511/g.23115 Transcript_12511/m.23115 type:complete len:185 (+) Transcript_12511:600-1154(+)
MILLYPRLVARDRLCAMNYSSETDNAHYIKFVSAITIHQKLYADDTTWILTSAFIILTMQSGFAMLEIGVSSPGNEVNVMMKNVCDLLFGTIAFFFFGYGIAFGEPSNGFSENFPAMNMNSELANVHVDSTCILSTLQWGWGTSYRRQTSMTPSRVGYSTRDISSILVLPQHLPQSSVVLLQCE